MPPWPLGRPLAAPSNTPAAPSQRASAAAGRPIIFALSNPKTQAEITAADCYRFCLSSPPVHAVLGGPRRLAQLDENLAGLQKGWLTAEEDDWMREYGRIVHG